MAFLNELKSTPLDGAYFVKPEDIVVPATAHGVLTAQMTLEGLGVSVVETEDDEPEVEVGDTIFYVLTIRPDHELTVRITVNQNNPTAGLISEVHPLAQAMLGATVGDAVALTDERGQRNYIVKKIVKAKVAEHAS